MIRAPSLAVLAGAVTLLALATGPVHAAGRADLGHVRQVTAKFHSVPAARHAGYHKFLPCIDAPGVGGMGQHFANQHYLDGVIQPLHPEVLVYAPSDEGYRLVAVDYVVPQAGWTGTTPPMLFGHQFHRNDTLGIWALHAWIWRHNPLGMFADFNPNVRLCPKD